MKMQNIPPPPSHVPGVVPRIFVEVVLAVLAIAVGGVIFASHDEQLFAEIASRHAVAVFRAMWGVIMALTGLIQLAGLAWCVHRGGLAADGGCYACPLRVACYAWRTRRIAAFASALAWGWLFILLLNGDGRQVAIAMTPVVAASQFVIFAILRPAVWKG